MFGYLVSRMLPVIPKGIVGKIASRYVAGEDLDAAVRTVRNLNERGRLATIDILGEDATDADEADATVKGYLEVLAAIRDHGLRSNISVKLTHLGLRMDRDAGRARFEQILKAAVAMESFVRIDMEDSSLTDTTLAIYQEMRERYGNAYVGTVLQSYLRRTIEDARRLVSSGPCNIRLCKGIYREPATIAFKEREAIRKSYIETAEVLLRDANAYVAFATHDRVLIEKLRELVSNLNVKPDRYEFQALLGVPVDDVLDACIADGLKVRVYVPFGRDWYPYSVRRLRENPRLATYIVKHMFGLGE